MKRRGVACLFAAGLAMGAGCKDRPVQPAEPPPDYVRTVRWGVPLWRKDPVVVFHLARGARTDEATEDGVRSAFEQAAKAWTDAAAGCSTVRVVLAAEPIVAPVAQDGRNVVALRADLWCRNGSEGGPCYAPEEQARTTVWLAGRERPAQPASGQGDVAEIEDSDIELNAVDYRFTAPGRPAAHANARELVGTFMHEIGHALGLDHPCAPGNVDLPGRRDIPPSCDRVPESMRASIMHPMFRPGHRPELSRGDRAFLCGVYPRSGG